MEDARTRIVCTVGPASASLSVLTRMMKAGMDIARLNFSHGSHDDHARLLKTVRAAARKADRTVAILQDLQGPKIRIGNLPEDGVTLHDGEVVQFSAELKEYKKGGPLPVSYARLALDVKPGHRILLDDGYLEVEVLRIKSKVVSAVVKVGGVLKSRKGMNLPDSIVTAPPVTPKDKEDLIFGVAHGVDWVCLSFVTKAETLHEIRRLVNAEARRYHVRPPLIMAKVERKVAVEHMDEIIEAADGIMLGRGDLGVEVAPELVPVIQKDIAEHCRRLGKPLIVATHMLESMKANPRATRAEVSDVANAVFDQVDAVMLSAESATGRYPSVTVQMMANVIKEAENSRFDELHAHAGEVVSGIESFAYSIALMAHQGIICAAVVASSAISIGSRINMFRPKVPIIAAVPDASAARQVRLRAGCYPVIIDDHAASFVPRLHAEVRSRIKGARGKSVAYITQGTDGSLSLSLVPIR